MLPKGTYRAVVIHDNFAAIDRFVRKKNPQSQAARAALMEYNGRFIVIPWTTAEGKTVALIASGMGSAPTNRLVECLKENNCQRIIKVGTCSALQSDLHEGDILTPVGSLIDEGATEWRRVLQAQKNFTDAKEQTRAYISDKRYVEPYLPLSEHILKKIPQAKPACLWSVDAYNCFDKSTKLIRSVNKETFQVSKWDGLGCNTLLLSGVEMECSALFSSAKSLNINAAAIIVVSRTRDRLLNPKKPNREKKRIHDSEQLCIETAIEIASEVL